MTTIVIKLISFVQSNSTLHFSNGNEMKIRAVKIHEDFSVRAVKNSEWKTTMAERAPLFTTPNSLNATPNSLHATPNLFHATLNSLHAT